MLRALPAALLALTVVAPAKAHDPTTVIIFKGSRDCAGCSVAGHYAPGPVVVVTPPSSSQGSRRLLLPRHVVLLESVAPQRLPVSPARSFVVRPSRD